MFAITVEHKNAINVPMKKLGINIQGQCFKQLRIRNNHLKHLKDLNITNSQISLMFVLSKKKSVKQSELSRIAILEKSTLNRNLKRLLERGLITRENFPLIEITEKGIDFVISAIPPWNAAMSEIREILKEKNYVQHFGGKLEGDELKTAPKGFDKQHPDIDLIRKKGYIAIQRFSDKEVLAPDFLTKVDDAFKALRPFFNYMSDVLTTNLNGESILD